MLEWFERNPSRNVRIVYVDIDSQAIARARSLKIRHLDTVCFSCKNVLRLKIDQRYELIWAAGLSDCFSNETFAAVVKHLLQALNDEGRIVIGNFSVKNSTRTHMELGWYLHHRSRRQLVELMNCSGIEAVGAAEPEEVNLFAVGTRYSPLNISDWPF